MAFDCFDTNDMKQAACWSATLLASVASKKDKGKVQESTGKMDLWTVLSHHTCPVSRHPNQVPHPLTLGRSHWMGTSKTYDRRFRVPGEMQIMGLALRGKTTWLFKLIQNAVTYFWVDTGGSVHFHLALYYYSSSWQPMSTRMQQNMGVAFHPGIPTIPWKEVFPPKQHPSC